MRQATLSLSEIVTIAICYKASHVNNFKTFFHFLHQLQRNLFQALPGSKNMITLINQHQFAIHALHYALTK